MSPASAAPLADHPALRGLSVLQRGWLSSNNVVIHAAPSQRGATLIDTSHINHVEQTLALLQEVLQGQALAHVVNTHLHSDHCGGNAAVQAAFGARLSIPPGQAEAVHAWDESTLSHAATGQRMARFVPDDLLLPGSALEAGDCRFEVLAAPGHDPDSVMLFEPQRGLLISADALWENGFGVVFPEVAGEPGFDDVGAVLDLIASLPVQLVIPGHGAPFTDVAAALARARSRLLGFQRDPARHVRHAAKVLIKYHLMEERRMSREALLEWVAATPLMAGLWQRFGRSLNITPQAWANGFVDELLMAGVLSDQGGWLCDV